MNTIMTTTIAIAATTMMATGALAGEAKSAMKSDTVNATTMKTQTVRTIDADGQVGEITIFDTEASDQKVAVLGTFSQQATNAYVVRDNEGDLYINHIIPVDELPDPNLDVEVIDTYEVTYRGMTFTNKIVNEQ